MLIKYNYSDKELNVQHVCNNKFYQDSFIYEDDDYQIYTYGYFLNDEALFKEYQVDSIQQLLLTLLREHTVLSAKLKGTFLITVLDKSSGNIFVYNDLLSKESLFYYTDDRIFAASDDYYQLLDFCRESQLPLTPDSLGLKMMTYTMVFYDDVTYFNEIKFLKPFNYIHIYDNQLHIQNIALPSPLTSMAEKDVINTLDNLFQNAVAEQHSKNERYGYDTISTLSGGMDSRAVLLYLRKLDKNRKITCYCYGETGSMDHEVAHQIASTFDYPFSFHSLNTGNFITNRDAMVDAIRGQMYYAGTTGLYDTLLTFKLNNVGIIHSGIVGGEILGDNCQDENKDGKSWSDFIHSLHLNNNEEERMKRIAESYSSYNYFVCLNETRRCVVSQKMAKHFNCEYCSPFLDEQFFSFMLTVPYAMKHKRLLYVNWQKKCNPEMFDFKTTHWLGASAGNEFSFFCRKVVRSILRRLGGKIKPDMNPFDYWNKTNPAIGTFLVNTFQQDRGVLQKALPPDILAQLERDWSQANLFNKMALLTSTRTLLHYYRPL